MHSCLLLLIHRFDSGCESGLLPDWLTARPTELVRCLLALKLQKRLGLDLSPDDQASSSTIDS